MKKTIISAALLITTSHAQCMDHLFAYIAKAVNESKPLSPKTVAEQNAAFEAQLGKFKPQDQKNQISEWTLD